MRQINNLLDEAGLAQGLPLTSPETFCLNLEQALKHLDPMAISWPVQSLRSYESAMELAESLIPGGWD
jgi:hypothetical protein